MKGYGVSLYLKVELITYTTSDGLITSSPLPWPQQVGCSPLRLEGKVPRAIEQPASF